MALPTLRHFNRHCGEATHSLILYAFDLLHLDGNDFRQRSLLERRAKLKALFGDDDESRIQFSDEFDGEGATLFKSCGDLGLEGIVSKHALAPYRSGRSRTWLKTKCFTESMFVVVGTDRDRKTGALSALLAYADDFGLIYAGAAFVALRKRNETASSLRLSASRPLGLSSKVHGWMM